MKITLDRWGDTQGIRLPEAFTKKIGAKVGDELSITLSADKKSLLIGPTGPTSLSHSRLDLAELLRASAHDAFDDGEVSWGERQGKEAW